MTMTLFALVIGACAIASAGKLAQDQTLICMPAQVTKIMEDLDACKVEAEGIRNDHDVLAACVPYGPLPLDPSMEPPA